MSTLRTWLAFATTPSFQTWPDPHQSTHEHVNTDFTERGSAADSQVDSKGAVDAVLNSFDYKIIKV